MAAGRLETVRIASTAASRDRTLVFAASIT
jgi:hypothetical protein